jgi:hypothetical protein
LKKNFYILFNLTVAPKWTQEPNDVKTSIKDISIVCKAEGEPKPIIQWITPEGKCLMLYK